MAVPSPRPPPGSRSLPARTVASKRCDNVSIQNNVVYSNGLAGIMLHRSSDDALVIDNFSYDNGDAGLALFESSYAKVYGNTFLGNKCESRGGWGLPGLGGSISCGL